MVILRITRRPSICILTHSSTLLIFFLKVYVLLNQHLNNRILYHLHTMDVQSLIMPKRIPTGLTFCPMHLSLNDHDLNYRKLSR